ncbi:class I tRNA ligase family protein, partial [Candidatus Uhrbacteria bacterium]|nr:class I tRNA ligase family protein [Candidatus Uhrbacteria bacterium]
WVNVLCSTCGGAAKRETDTMPNWAGSSWYFLRYCDSQNDQAFASPKALNHWMPVDLYNGGMEHTTLHLLYSRFWHKFLWDIGAIPKEVGSEPYKARRSHGLVLAQGGEKMSKSKGNVVNPDEIVQKYGADVLRVYELFMGPFDQQVPWDTNGIEGVRRFLDKVWGVFVARSTQQVASDLERLYHQTIKKITEGIDALQFNTCVSQMMILTNAFQDVGGVPEEMREGYLKILAPFAPHLAEELWHQIGKTDTIHRSSWPTYDPGKLQSDTFELVIQINGKVRDKIVVSSDITEEEAKETALASTSVQKWLEGKTPTQIKYVPGKLLSIVV